MSLQSERLLNHMLRLRLTHLPNCFEAIAEEAFAEDLPYLDFLEQALEAESQAKHIRNVRLKTQWAHFPYNKGLDQFDFAFQPSVYECKPPATPQPGLRLGNIQAVQSGEFSVDDDNAPQQIDSTADETGERAIQPSDEA